MPNATWVCSVMFSRKAKPAPLGTNYLVLDNPLGVNPVYALVCVWAPFFVS